MAANPFTCHDNYSAHRGVGTTYPDRDSEPDQCQFCGAPIEARLAYFGSANLRGNVSATFEGRASETVFDPLAKLAEGIGAKMPFNVYKVIPDEGYRQTPTLVGRFAGGEPISVAIAAWSEIRWYATGPETVANDDN